MKLSFNMQSAANANSYQSGHVVHDALQSALLLVAPHLEPPVWAQLMEDVKGRMGIDFVKRIEQLTAQTRKKG